MPKIEHSIWSEHAGGVHQVIGLDNGPYANLPLGDVVGLSQFGVHLERLPPGSRSSFRHWHEGEDEFIYVVSGELVLIEDQEVLLQAGEAARVESR
ncbi:cupin domain-containing protein [Sulfitobacter sediminilitoris]|uniref:cupin domain-containing protein n=1 Tax=Sulfitobacter sediminilitoris TaxID=2698830 RepID=UPI001F2E8356|nr:cupin domain-containing protein [Sulfitobacter sediminilitoris]